MRNTRIEGCNNFRQQKPSDNEVFPLQKIPAGVRVVVAKLASLRIPPYTCTLTLGSRSFVGDVNPGSPNPGSMQRRALNTWIRTAGPELPGVVAIGRFDEVFAAPTHLDFIIPNLYSNDTFHPNGTGYGIQNSAIPLASLLGRYENT